MNAVIIYGNYNNQLVPMRTSNPNLQRIPIGPNTVIGYVLTNGQYNVVQLDVNGNLV